MSSRLTNLEYPSRSLCPIANALVAGTLPIIAAVREADDTANVRQVLAPDVLLTAVHYK